MSAIKGAFTGDHYDQLEQLKQDLKEICLSSFPGEEVQAANEVIKDIMQRLDAAEMLQVGDTPLLDIMTVYEESSSEHFRLWAVKWYDDVKSFVDRCRLADPVTRAGLPDQITYEVLTTWANSKYLDLVGAGRYPSAVTGKYGSDQRKGPFSMVAAVTTNVATSEGQSLQRAAQEIDTQYLISAK